MATHDYEIDNSTGANVRIDINNVLKAILTNNSGTTDPATIISTNVGSKAFSFWADTNSSPAVLKIRNAADNAWIELFQLDGTLTLEDGSASTPALAFRDDLNTGIFSSAADTFNVATGGVERMELGATTIFNEDGADVDFRIESDSVTHMFFIDSGNNRVGISDSSPTCTFEVGGTTSQTAIFQSNQSTTTVSILDTDGDGLNISGGTAFGHRIHTSTSESLQLGVNNSTKLTIDSSGRVLIGTTTEGNAFADDLTIATAAQTGITIRSGTTHTGNIYFSDATSGGAEAAGFFEYDHNTNKFSFGTNELTGVQINSSGKVSVLRAGLNLENATATNSRAFSITNSAGSTGWSFGNGIIASAHQFVIYDNTAGSARLLINSSGLVGIGETNPTAALDVVTSTAVVAEFHATGASGGYIGLFTGANGAAQGYIGRSGQLVGSGGTADNLAIRSENEIEFAINTSGTVTQRAKITVNGIETTSTIKVSTAANLVNPITVDDSINNNFSTNALVFQKGSSGSVGSISCTRTATSYNTSSDYRLKENAVAISDGITRLKTLIPRRFNWISDDTNTLVDGFFAHEVTAVPEAITGTKDEVATEDIDGKNIKKGDPIYQQIDQAKLVPLLVAAVQELITKVETLEAA